MGDGRLDLRRGASAVEFPRETGGRPNNGTPTFGAGAVPHRTVVTHPSQRGSEATVTSACYVPQHLHIIAGVCGTVVR